MVTTRLFRITQASHTVIPYVLVGLSQRWTDPDLKFDSEYDSRNGDFYVVVNTTDPLPETVLKSIVEGK